MEDSHKKFKFYVYQYVRASDNTPYYIGKGSGWRLFSRQHSVTTPKDRSKIHVIAKSLTETEAHILEKKLIKFYGRNDLGAGILHNKSDGGEGSSGAFRSAETRAKISKAHLGRKRKPVSEETKQRMRLAHLGNNKGTKKSEETRKRMSVAQKGRIVTIETTKKWYKSMELRRLSGIKDIRNIKQVTCPHCNKIGGGGNMTRYHFDNCKKNYA